MKLMPVQVMMLIVVAFAALGVLSFLVTEYLKERRDRAEADRRDDQWRHL